LFQPLYYASSFLSSTPPEASTIKAIGTFSTKFVHHGTLAPGYDVVFSTNDGKKYISKDHDAPHELKDLAKSNPLTEVYAEGFLLQNGKGSFWPILVKTTDGRVLIDKDKMQTSYNNRRWKNPMLVMIEMLTLFAAPCWLISIFNAYQIKRKLTIKGRV
jgi:hypothetical protein